MYKSPLAVFRRLLILAGIASLASCGGGGGGGTAEQNIAPASGEVYEITGGAIKGPLAYANVAIYALDTRFSTLYNPADPIATATTDSYAQITGLKVSKSIKPPYVMVIDGSNAVDLNTGVAPVVSTLVTVLSEESLAARQPVYTTPYSTLAYQMLTMYAEGQTSTSGNGLNATYYNDSELSDVALQRIDPNVSFDWGGNSPASGIDGNTFSVRWSGYIEPRFSEKYTFYTSTNDGVRLWIDNQLIVDYWNNQTETEHSGTISLVAGKKYPIVMEYYQNGGTAAANLLWSSASQPKSAVPSDNFYSNADSGRGTIPELSTLLETYSQQIVRTLGFGISSDTHVFTTPPILQNDPGTVEELNTIVNYRAAIEALSTLLYNMSIASGDGTSTDALLRRLARDLYSDGVIDAAANGRDIGAIDMAILTQNPMNLMIANTQYRVRNILDLIDEEASLVGASSTLTYDRSAVVVSLSPIDGMSSSDTTGSTGTSTTTSTDTSTSAPSTGTTTDTTSNSTATTGTSTTGTSTTDSNAGSGSTTATVTVPKGTVLKVDFENHSVGSYTKQDAMRDFNANESTEAVSISYANVVNDPSGGNRGKVMRITHLANKGGGTGGFRFKARFPEAEEYYFAFDLYIPNNYEFIGAEKLPGLMYGTLLEASHGSGVSPIPEGVKAFSVMHQLLGAASYPSRGDGKMSSYVYDADRVQYDEFFDMVYPSDSTVGTTWHFPKGQWVRVEQRIRQNTATSTNGVGDKADGILQEWVNGKLVVDKRKRFRTVNTMKIDGIYMYSYYGGKPTDDVNKPSQDQHEYYDNFIVSTSPITH